MNKRLIGSTLLLTSTVIYGLYGIFSRYVSGFGSFSQSWVRSSITLSVILLMLVFKKFEWQKVKKYDLKWFLIWILPASLQPVITFMAFNHLSLGMSYFLIYSTMILGGIISGKIFFSERLNLNKVFSLVLVFIGLFLIYQSDITLVNNIYVLFALLSGLLVGFWNTLSKKVSGKYSEFQMMSLDQSTTLLVCFIGSTIAGEKLPAFYQYHSWIWILIFALSNVATMFLLIRGFKYVEAQIGSLILPLEIIFASIFGYLIFGEVLKINIYLGGLFILAAALLPALKFPKHDD